MTRPQDVTVDDAATWLGEADAPLVVDVRTPAEFEGTRIPGAVNIPIDLIEEHRDEIAGKLDGEVLFVCRTDNRAHRAATLLAGTLAQRGHVLTGGMRAWEQEHRNVEKGTGGVWAMDRQVRTAAGALALGSILASIVAPKARWLAGGIGAGLLYSGVSDTCAMSSVLAKMPWNKRDDAPTVASVTQELAQRN